MSELTEKQRKQNLFDATWKTAQEMDHPSLVEEDGSTHCMYLAPDGNKCFIGARLRPGRYTPEMDDRTLGSSVHSILQRFPEIKQDLLDDGFSTDISFLMGLQQVHDNAFGNRFENLKQLAREYVLDFPADAVQS